MHIATGRNAWRRDGSFRDGELALGLGTLLFAGMLMARVLYSGVGCYAFIGFNLALAWIPWLTAWALERSARADRRALSYALGAAWLAFLPNAPYLVSDLVHLRHRAPVPLWYDVLLLSTAAITGLLAGAFSLRRVERVVRASGHLYASRALVSCAVIATGFGIYLGRVERLSSWDLALHPLRVLHVIAHAASPRAIVMSAAAAGLSAIAYLALRDTDRDRVTE
ncbi:MAG: DUF1361 domain-containing protein [Sandaracinaceae bacterium]